MGWRGKGEVVEVSDVSEVSEVKGKGKINYPTLRQMRAVG